MFRDGLKFMDLVKKHPKNDQKRHVILTKMWFGLNYKNLRH